MTITAKELSAIEDQLSHEQNLISKYSAYASECTDPQLKSRYEEIVTRHQKHFDALFGIINCCRKNLFKKGRQYYGSNSRV